MFALIDTNNATHIAIHIPREGAEKTIPALVGMFENNAVFIRKGYGTLETCEPSTTIQLGEKVSLNNHDSELVVIVPDSEEILCHSFSPIAPDVLISNSKGIERREAEIQRLRTELAHVKQKLEDLEAAAEREQGF